MRAQSCRIKGALTRRCAPPEGGEAPSPDAARHPLPRGEGMIVGQGNQRNAQQRAARQPFQCEGLLQSTGGREGVDKNHGRGRR